MGLALNKVYQGDCLDGLARLGAGTIDLAFADPPFNIGYDYDVYDDNRESDEYVRWSQKWMTGVYRALKLDGAFWLAIGDEYAAELKVAAQKIGFHCRSWVIWYYTFGVNCVRGFSRSHTHLLYFVKDPLAFTFNADNPMVRVKSARELVYGDRRANPRGRLPDNTWILRPQDVPDSFTSREDTWYFPRVAGTFREREGFHGCQMPEQLLGRIMRCCSNPLDVVLDPFAGSGTTLTVAKKLGRRWIGFELSQDYVKRIRQRLRLASAGNPLDGAADPLASAPATNGRAAKRGKNSQRRAAGAALRPKRLKRRPPTKEFVDGIVAAFRAVHDGHSVDRLLTDPELDGAFLDACKKAGVGGYPAEWNRALLRIRKSGKLPRVSRREKVLALKQMDAYSDAAEIAMHHLALELGATFDGALCDPRLIPMFDEIAAQFAPGHSPREYRWAALAIRKRAARSKKAAAERYRDWRTRRLPRGRALSSDWSKYSRPGVYIVSTPDEALYVGETFDIRGRVERIRELPAWQRLHPSTVRLMPEDCMPHALQAALIGRTGALLNAAEILSPDRAGHRAK